MSDSEREVIAIRGLDPALYSQVIAKAKEAGKNVSELVNDALKRYLNEVLGTPVILDTRAGFTLSRADLEKLGKVIIRGSLSLKFTEDVDDQVFDDHVVALEDCMSVRVPTKAYIAVLKKARNIGSIQPYGEQPDMEAGHLGEEMLESTAMPFEGSEAADIVRIGDIEELELSKEDFESLGKRVVLERIQHLKLASDVDTEIVSKYITLIRGVQELEVPKSVYMLVLTRQRGCQTITRY